MTDAGPFDVMCSPGLEARIVVDQKVAVGE
jgi:hypothetical protein